MPEHPEAIRAQAHLHHAWLLGLQLSVAVHEGAAATGEWMFRLFRRQHEAKFLASFDKLGLAGLPNAVACARYHVLSNDVGGVGVEYAEESERKAWVRFRYPRWMYAGPTICGVPVETSRGFLRGWYAHNGVSLGDPQLRFVCVSEDMTGQFGLCGYFERTDRPLGDDERLHFAPDELPPDFARYEQPALPETGWSPERREKARRNYALEYLRNGLPELAAVIGDAGAREHGRRTARLIGLQYQAELAERLGCEDGDLDAAATFLGRLLAGMGDAVEVSGGGASRTLVHRGLRIVRDLPAADADRLLHCWTELFGGLLAAQRQRKDLDVERTGEGLRWTITPAATAP
jgi:hypothetical protein